MFRCLSLLLTLLVPSSLVFAQWAVPGFSSGENEIKYIPDQLLVRFHKRLLFQEAIKFGKAFGMTPMDEIRPLSVWVYEIQNGEDVNKLVPKVIQNPRVSGCDLNHIRTLEATQPLADQWYLVNAGQVVNGRSGPVGLDVNWVNALSQTTNSYPVRVAIVDSGVAVLHPDLIENIYQNQRELNGVAGVDDDGDGLVDDFFGWDFYYDSADMLDRNGHGTHVAGIVGAAGSDGVGAYGVNPLATLIPIRVLDQWGRGKPEGVVSVSNIAKALIYAYLSGARIVNMSLGGSSYNIVEIGALEFLREKGVLVVVAAGNGGDDGKSDNNDQTPFYPSSYPNENIVSVAAQDRNGWFAPFSNYGLNSVDILAPGVDIQSTYVTRKAFAAWSFDPNSSVTGWTVGSEPGNLSSLDWVWMSELGVLDDGSQSFNYQSNTNTWVMTPEIFAQAQVGSVLKVRYSTELEEWTWLQDYPDYVLVEFSTDAINWKVIAGWTGSTGGNWREVEYNLPELDGSSGYVRFRLISDWSLNYGGVRLDEVQFLGTDIFASFDEPRYNTIQGTSMAAPIVSGVASLLLTERPDLTMEDLRSILLATVIPVEGASNYISSGGMVDAGAAIATAKSYPLRDYNYWRNRMLGAGARTAWNESYTDDRIPNLLKIATGLDPSLPFNGSFPEFEQIGGVTVFRIPRGREVAGVSLKVEASMDLESGWVTVADKPFGYGWTAVTNSIATTFSYEEVFDPDEGLPGWAFYLWPVNNGNIPLFLRIRAEIDAGI